MDRISPSDGDDMGSTPVSNTILYWNRKIDMIKCSTCRYSLVVKQILGKDQRTVQFCLSAPLANLFELFQKVEFVVDQSLKDWSFFVVIRMVWMIKVLKKNTHRGIIKKENRIYTRILRYKTNYKKWKY